MVPNILHRMMSLELPINCGPGIIALTPTFMMIPHMCDKNDVYIHVLPLCCAFYIGCVWDDGLI